jgi:putative oxidoreductase
MTNLVNRCRQLVPASRHTTYAIPLRLIVGYGFMEHGYAKILHDPDVFISILHILQVPAPAILGWVTILVELFGGAAVLLGVFIPLVSVPMAIVLLVAIFSVHISNGFSSIKLLSIDDSGAHFGQPGYETDLLYLAGLAALVLGGSGPLALDRLLINRLSVTILSDGQSIGATGISVSRCHLK